MNYNSCFCFPLFDHKEPLRLKKDRLVQFTQHPSHFVDENIRVLLTESGKTAVVRLWIWDKTCRCMVHWIKALCHRGGCEKIQHIHILTGRKVFFTRFLWMVNLKPGLFLKWKPSPWASSLIVLHVQYLNKTTFSVDLPSGVEVLKRLGRATTVIQPEAVSLLFCFAYKW